MQKQRIIILIVGIVLALFSLAMVMAYVDQQVRTKQEQMKEAVAKQLANQVAVLVAKTDIPKGATLEPAMLETAIVPGQYVQPQAATSMDRISGMMVIAPIEKGEQISMSKLVISRDASGGSLAMATPVGKRAVTINIDNVASVAGMVRPGDYVDVIVTVPVPVQVAEGKRETQLAVVSLFQNILVLAVGQETGTVVAPPAGRYDKGEKPAASASPLYTLALNPQEASLLAFVQEAAQGKFKLALRSPTDAKVESISPASWDTLFQYMTPREQIEAKEKEERLREEQARGSSEDSGPYIEIYRGMKKDKLPMGK